MASEIVNLGIIPSSVKPKTQKILEFTASLFDTQIKRTVMVMIVITILKT